MLRYIYYQVKPRVSWRMRLKLRQWHTRRLLLKCGNVWPIDEAAGKTPASWMGWPEGKQFALVLTHDVEGPDGLERVEALAELEMRLGLRSCFKFIPEGDYQVPSAVRGWLGERSFEVGVHDLHHDGKLYLSRRAFKRHAQSINRYLREWNVVGFRSGFMMHRLDWLHDLEIVYDASTFDTDPFEPQPDGVSTIFPFRVSGPDGKGYWELPYTLAQDSTLFIVMQQRNIEVWKRKLDWVAERGGMALLNVHPDYLAFAGTGGGPRTYPSTFYSEFLRYVQTKYGNVYWNALPREVCQHLQCAHGASLKSVSRLIDKENSRVEMIK
jgi:hypothetical protein